MVIAVLPAASCGREYLATTKRLSSFPQILNSPPGQVDERCNDTFPVFSRTGVKRNRGFSHDVR